MNRLSVWPRVLLMALASMAGIVGMLLYEGAGDVVCFVLTAMPPILGGWYAWRMRGSRRTRPAVDTR